MLFPPLLCRCFGRPAKHHYPQLRWLEPFSSGASRHNGTSLLRMASVPRAVQPAGQCLRATWAAHASSKQLPKPPGTYCLRSGYLYTRPLSVYQTRERLYREGWGATGALSGLQELSGVGGGRSAPLFMSPFASRVGRDSSHVLWPISKVTAMGF